MFYLTYTPRYPLSRFIESFWYAERAPQLTHERLLPNGAIDIVLNLRDATLRFYDHANLSHPRTITGPVASGAHDRYYVIDTLQQSSLLGVRFLLGGAYTFLGAAADQLHNRRVALEDLWGRPAIELQTRLMEAKTREARFERIERAFLSRLADAVRPHPAIAKAISRLVAQHGASSVTDVALRSGLSQRRFIELFQREVGLSPKTLCRVLRFQWALRLITNASRPNLAALAVDCGYYDQSHLIRDFKAFAGVTPTAYHHSRAGPCPGGHFKALVGVTPTAYPARRGRRHNHAPMGEGGQIYPIPGQASSLE